MKNKRSISLLTLALLTCVAGTSAHAALSTIIYQESFDGSGSLLNGTSTDAVGVGASTTWSANSFALDNGAIDGTKEGSALLPFNSTTTFA